MTSRRGNMDVGEKWLTPKQVAEKYNVCYNSALKCIKQIMGDDVGIRPKNRSRPAKRPRKLRRVPETLLAKHIDDVDQRVVTTRRYLTPPIPRGNR